MKKVFNVVLIIIISLVPIYVFAGNEIKQATYQILINNKVMQSDLPILNLNGNTYIPLRKVTEEMGYDVKWSGEKRIVELNKEDTDKVILDEFKEAIDEKVIINGLNYEMRTVIGKDMMPGIYDYNKLLNEGLEIYLTEGNGESFSDKITLEKAWFEYRGKFNEIIFIRKGSVIKENDNNFIYVIDSIKFPFEDFIGKGESEAKVNVYAKVLDSSTNKHYLLKSANVPVSISN